MTDAKIKNIKTGVESHVSAETLASMKLEKDADGELTFDKLYVVSTAADAAVKSPDPVK